MNIELFKEHVKSMLDDRNLTENDLLKIRETIVKLCVEHLEEQFPDAEILTLEEFSEGCTDGIYSPYDGDGYFWDGTEKTDISVWDDKWTSKDIESFDFVIWYDIKKGDTHD